MVFVVTMMRVTGNRTKIGLGFCLCLSGAALAFAQTPEPSLARWPLTPSPQGTVPIPIVVPRSWNRNAERLTVCMQAGTAPQEFRVLGSGTCWSGAEHCTVFVAVPSSNALLIVEYDAKNPPVLADGSANCSKPSRPIEGVL